MFLQKELSKTLENTAFIGDLALHFPDFFGKQYANKQSLQELVKWAFVFANNTNLFDETTQAMLQLVNGLVFLRKKFKKCYRSAIFLRLFGRLLKN
jgi:hypothetical protein